MCVQVTRLHNRKANYQKKLPSWQHIAHILATGVHAAASGCHARQHMAFVHMSLVSACALCFLRICRTPYLLMALHAVLLHRLHGTPVAVLNIPRLASQLAQLAAQLAAKATRFACSKCHFEGTLPVRC